MEQNVNAQRFENIVECENGRMFTTSLIVAEVFEKEHKDVLRECPAYTLLYQFSPKDTG